MSIRCIIVDDEPLGRERIRRFVESTGDLLPIAECEDGRSAVESIEAENPDLIFLDIQMPDLDGFGVIDELKKRKLPLPLIIFVTAYNEYAVKAFEIHAFDYLLKPVQKARFAEAIDRVRQQHSHKGQGNQLEERLTKLLAEVQAPAKPTYLQRIEVRSQSRIDYVNVSKVLYLEADGNYVETHTQERTHLARVTIAQLESKLDPAQFVRISRSSLVNLAAVRSIKSVGRRDHVVELIDGKELPLTRSQKELQERLQFPG